jgi:hypothetical protein
LNSESCFLWCGRAITFDDQTSIAEIAQREGITARYVRRMLRLAFLAPEIVEAIASEIDCL